jgi:hypothetical protein
MKIVNGTVSSVQVNFTKKIKIREYPTISRQF